MQEIKGLGVHSPQHWRKVLGLGIVRAGKRSLRKKEEPSELGSS